MKTIKTTKTNAAVAPVNVPVGKLTESGTDSAKAGVSMQAMIQAAVLEAMKGMQTAVQPTVTTPVATKAKPATVAKASPKVAHVPASKEIRAAFDPRAHYALGANIAASEDGSMYIAQSANTGHLVAVGVPLIAFGRKAECYVLPLESAAILRDLLNAVPIPA